MHYFFGRTVTFYFVFHALEDESPYIDVAICGSHHPPPELPPQPEELSKEDVVRRHIVQSIIDSENSYVKTLSRLIQVMFMSGQFVFLCQI